jgi:hypothetical protein
MRFPMTFNDWASRIMNCGVAIRIIRRFISAGCRAQAIASASALEITIAL